ncbi:hypothetical protein EDB86DRAFT_427231 [Lactarius hatsudake]|nr:hypothetical protein EDB86DRAFT_427231 [Lactarius hatsudake]
MADVRALLKAKRQEARVTHPYATYNASGALRCAACGAAVKFASAWEGHLGSKAHRVAVANLKAKEEAEASSSRLKRNAEQEQQSEDADAHMEVEVEPPAKRRRTEERELAAGFPTDFFSDPSRAPQTLPEDDDDDDDDMVGDKTSAAPKSQLDLELAAFERDLQQQQQQREQPADPQETYARATVAAEPELVPRFEGLPGEASAGGEEPPPSEKEQKVSEEEERRRKQEEERELIMDRLLEEERAQEEADSRVATLKSRVEMLKKRRELAKVKGNKTEART